MRPTGLTLLALALWSSAAAAVVRLEAESETVDAPGDERAICIHLDSGGQEVAGTENRLVWDGACATGPRDATGCFATGQHDKMLSWDYSPTVDFSLKALVLSLTDVDPLPDTELYCCVFAAEAEPGSCCPISVVAAGASDPQGNALPTEGNTAQLCVAASVGEDDDGCQVGAPRGGAEPLVAALLALLLARRRGARSRAGALTPPRRRRGCRIS